MKRFFRILTVFLALTLLSCGSGPVTLTYQDGKLVNRLHHLAYTPAPLNYEPAAIGEQYAVYKKLNQPLYAIVGLDPQDWLTEANSGLTTTIFHRDSITLPTLREMKPDEVFVCINSSITFAGYTIKDQDTIDLLIDLFENGEGVSWPMLEASRIYELKFHSTKDWPHIYYNLTYGKFPEGNFLYDRVTKRCVELGDLLGDEIDFKP